MLPPNENGNGAEIIALQALVWVLGDEDRAARLLALTGLDADQLRAGVDDPAILGAVFDFLAAHEPDLLACADWLGLAPEKLMMTAKEIRR
ncbi:MAG: DUF3572 family protein [Sphingobium sp.]|nr:DUF3572 family protein [Sphingobium sp.]